MAEQEKFVSNLLKVTGARLAFADSIHEAKARRGKNGAAPKPDAKKVFTWELVLDPSNAQHAEEIKAIKQETYRALTFKFGADVANQLKPQFAPGGGNWPPGMHICWGYGNDLPKAGKKLYDGYADMFWIRVKRFEEDGRPLLANRAGQLVQKGDPQCPYAGSFVNSRFTMWPYNNESRGVNATGRSIQFVKDGQAFGGGGSLDPEQEFEALGDAPAAAGAGGGDDWLS